jgi:hypothetical protein
MPELKKVNPRTLREAKGTAPGWFHVTAEAVTYTESPLAAEALKPAGLREFTR